MQGSASMQGSSILCHIGTVTRLPLIFIVIIIFYNIMPKMNE